MSFKHACFISYRHSDKEKTVSFIKQFVDALENCLDQYVPCGVFLDRERLKSGYKFNEAITQALRESVCLVAILSLEYFRSSYCRREYHAMREIEDQRREIIGKPEKDRGLIIPILVWASVDDVPAEIRNEIHFDPIKFSLTNLRNEIKYDPNQAAVMERISEVVIELYRSFEKEELCEGAVDCCTEINLPTEAEVEGLWKPRLSTPQPLPSRVGIGVVQ